MTGPRGRGGGGSRGCACARCVLAPSCVARVRLLLAHVLRRRQEIFLAAADNTVMHAWLALLQGNRVWFNGSSVGVGHVGWGALGLLLTPPPCEVTSVPPCETEIRYCWKSFAGPWFLSHAAQSGCVVSRRIEVIGSFTGGYRRRTPYCIAGDCA